MKNLNKTLTAPSLPKNLSNKAQWLAGEGAGSWFEINELDEALSYRIIRYSAFGELECESVFIPSTVFNSKTKYAFTYPSHCAKISILQDSKIIVFTRIN
jgi:hypothetical protein